MDAPAQDAQVNVVGTVNVLEAARATGARVLFGSSGGTLYGRNAPIPSREDVLPLPESPVGIAKYCAEQYIGLYNRLHGTRHSILRLANVYGPRQDPGGDAGVIPIFCGCVLAGTIRPCTGTAPRPATTCTWGRGQRLPGRRRRRAPRDLEHRHRGGGQRPGHRGHHR